MPTVAEQGYPDFEMKQWYGVPAPASLSASHVDRLAAASARAVKEPVALDRLSADAAIAASGTPGEFAAFIAIERERWKPVLARARVKPD